MILRVKGRPHRITLQEAKKATNFFAEQLMSPKMLNNIDVLLWFSEEETKERGWFGYADWKDRNHRPRLFELAVDPMLTRKTLLKTIAHEMTHIKQFATGQLKDYIRMDGAVGWMGKLYKDSRHLTDSGYDSSPWERDAVKMENKLYELYQEHYNFSVRGI